jgi:hypothetical protein
MQKRLGLQPPETHDLKNRERIGNGPEGGHDHQAEKDVLALQKRGAQPDEMGYEDAGARPVYIMDSPPCVRRIFKQLIHAGPPH